MRQIHASTAASYAASAATTPPPRDSPPDYPKPSPSGGNSKNKCSHCRKPGHDKEGCFKIASSCLRNSGKRETSVKEEGRT